MADVRGVSPYQVTARSLISRKGKSYRVGRPRLLRKALVRLYGRRSSRPRQQRRWGGHFRHFTRAEQLQLWQYRARGWSNRRIARRMGRDHRSIDRRMTDHAALHLALALAADDVGWVHAPTVAAGIQDGVLCAAHATTLGELLLLHRQDWRRWWPMWRRWQRLTGAAIPTVSAGAARQP